MRTRPEGSPRIPSSSSGPSTGPTRSTSRVGTRHPTRTASRECPTRATQASPLRDMSWAAAWPWLALLGLGAYHGANPGMGWLFAVGRGLQERSRRAVLGSLLPIAVGHEMSIVLLVVPVAGQCSDLRQLGVTALLAASVHVAAMITVMGAVSVVVFEKVGLGFLRRGWFNLDLAWSGVLLLSGAITLFSAG